MQYTIRPVCENDAYDIHEIRLQAEVLPNILSVPSETVDATRNWLCDTDPASQHIFVAEAQLDDGSAKVVGIASMTISGRLRQRHVALAGIMLHKDYHGMGIGTNLMKQLIDLADNWLNLVRLELDVLSVNEGAMRFYERLGFEREGVKRMDTVRLGKYVDSVLMARINYERA
ncbi:MAG: GNAT family N-acetyltransferase [Defluviitaleaceae bacterium]|nr:GNAT family N-acetyltransferase [Defluviitaleaceae bacterium]